MLRMNSYENYLLTKEASKKRSKRRAEQAGTLGVLGAGGYALGKRIGKRIGEKRLTDMATRVKLDGKGGRHGYVYKTKHNPRFVEKYKASRPNEYAGRLNYRLNLELQADPKAEAGMKRYKSSTGQPYIKIDEAPNYIKARARESMHEAIRQEGKKRYAFKGRKLGGRLGAAAGLGTGIALATAYNRYKRSKK